MKNSISSVVQPNYFTYYDIVPRKNLVVKLFVDSVVWGGFIDVVEQTVLEELHSILKK